MMEYVHKSVMLKEVLESLAPSGNEPCILVDGTLGEGGHSLAFLEQFPNLRLIGIDTDREIQEKAKFRLRDYADRCRFVNSWYDEFFTQASGEEPVDRILLDLGISIFHYQESQRGFSFSKEEPLDMRLSVNAGPSAADFLADHKAEEIARVLFEYGEERYSRRIAAAVLRAREEQGSAYIRNLSSKEFAELIWKAVPADYRHGRIHPATRSFQALRIEVNHELERIDRALRGAFKLLKPSGRLGVISFHSLEDRLVKRYFQELAKACICPPNLPRCECGGKPRAKILTKKPLEAQAEELKVNPPSRSAKFRVVEKINYGP